MILDAEMQNVTYSICKIFFVCFLGSFKKDLYICRVKSQKLGENIFKKYNYMYNVYDHLACFGTPLFDSEIEAFKIYGKFVLNKKKRWKEQD